jgi:hypothetical protein
MVGDVCVCVLTCPPAGKAVSNTKAYQSPLDVPPPPRNLTTRIKAKLRITHHNPSSRTHQTSSPKENGRQPGRLCIPVAVAAFRCWKQNENHHSSDPVASATSKSIFCSHHQRRGIAPRFLSPCIHSSRIGRVATYIAIVCRQTSIYSPMVCSPHSSKTSSDFGYTH